MRAALLVVLAACLTPTEVDPKADGPRTTPGEEAATTLAEAEVGKLTDGAAEGGSAALADGGPGTLYVVNTSVEEVCFLYVAVGGVWSDDLLGADVLGVEAYLTVTGVPAAEVEVYAEACKYASWYAAPTVDGEWTVTLEGGGSGSGYDTGDDTGL